MAPGDFLIVKGKVARSEGGIGGIGVGIPLGDEALGEGDVHGDGGFARGIEIEDGSLHADGAAQAALECDFTEMFDEGGEVGGSSEREPVLGLAIGAGDGSESAPFVDGEIAFTDLSGCDVAQRKRESEENRRGHEAE